MTDEWAIRRTRRYLERQPLEAHVVAFSASDGVNYPIIRLIFSIQVLAASTAQGARARISPSMNWLWALQKTQREMKGSRMTDWTDLLGREVRIQKYGRTIRQGKVDAVGATADTLWVAASGVEPRSLYEKAQGYTAVLVSDQD